MVALRCLAVAGRNDDLNMNLVEHGRPRVEYNNAVDALIAAKRAQTESSDISHLFKLCSLAKLR